MTSCCSPTYEITIYLFFCTLYSVLCLVSLSQGDEELAIDVMDRLSASVLESFVHLTGADQVRECRTLCFWMLVSPPESNT